MTQTEFPAVDSKIVAQWKLSAGMRGRYIDRTIVVEAMIDDILSRLLCSQERKRYLLKSLLAKINLSIKMKFLVTVLRKLLPDKDVVWRELAKEFDRIRNFRNTLAHSQLDVSKEWLCKNPQDRIRLVSFSHGRRTLHLLTGMELIKEMMRSSRVLYRLFEIQSTMIQRATTDALDEIGVKL